MKSSAKHQKGAREGALSYLWEICNELHDQHSSTLILVRWSSYPRTLATEEVEMNFIYVHATAVANIALGFCLGIFSTLIFQEFTRLYVARTELERHKHLFNQKANRMVEELRNENDRIS